MQIETPAHSGNTEKILSEFALYIKLGFKHIADFAGYDHILFLVALCAPYKLKYWNQILILVTAFTIGHSITLAVSTLGLIPISSDMIEFLIPVTIFLTCLLNILKNSEKWKNHKLNLNYALALFFGFIHGMGFSNYLRALLGKEESIITPLFAFNIGLEVGQIMIVSIILAITFFVIKIFNVVHRRWNIAVSGVAACLAIFLMIQTKFW